MRLLLVEDDRILDSSVANMLQQRGYAVDVAYSGVSAQDKAESFSDYDVVLLDLMLPDMYGMDLLPSFRELLPTTPVMVLSAESEIEKKVTGFSYGIDDYVVKPVNAQELLARLRALTRSQHMRLSKRYEQDAFYLLPETHLVVCEGRVISLSNLEYRLLAFLLVNRGQAFSSFFLMREIWDCQLIENDSRVATTISRLRLKLGDCQKRYIRTNKRGYFVA